MAITDRERRNVFTSFEAAHGEEVANLIMQLLPQQPSDQLVTRTDMHTFGDALRAELKGEMAELRAGLQTEMADLRSELRSEMGELKTELRGEMGELRTELKTHTTRVVMGGAVVNVLAVLGATGLA